MAEDNQDKKQTSEEVAHSKIRTQISPELETLSVFVSTKEESKWKRKEEIKKWFVEVLREIYELSLFEGGSRDSEIESLLSTDYSSALSQQISLNLNDSGAFIHVA